MFISKKSSPVQIGSSNDWSKVSCGDFSVVAIKTDNTFWSWGYNLYGQLGIGNTNHKSHPDNVGQYNNWSKVSSKLSHVASIKNDGSLWVFGRNNYGQLGDFSSLDRLSPVRIGGDGIKWSKVSCGNYHTTAILNDGTLWAWGFNDFGQLGDGTKTNKSSPVQIGFLTNWSEISCGTDFTLAVKTNGTIWAWGLNSSGQLGLGTVINKSSPVQIGALINWVSSSCGNDHVLAIKSDGTIWAWGNNSSGQLGDGTKINKLSPVKIGLLTNWSGVSCGTHFTLAVKTNGTLWAWGLNSSGQLGLGDNSNRSSPVQVGALINWSSVSCGESHTLSIKTNGTLWGFGDNTYGQLNNDQSTNTYAIEKMMSISDVYDMVCGVMPASYGFVAFLKGDGSLWRLFAYFSSPTQVGSLYNWASLYSSGSNYFSINSDSELYKDGAKFEVRWSDISSGGDHSVAIMPDRTLWTWGKNSFGQLGLGDITSRSFPTQVGLGSDWLYVSAGEIFTLATKTDGTLWSWGDNSIGQLGLGDISNRSSPVQVGLSTTWINIINKPIFCGRHHVLAIQNGTLWSWGWNGQGQLGLGDTTNRSSPVQVGASSTWIKAAGGSGHSLATRNDVGSFYVSTLWSWGINTYGQLGLGDTTSTSSPVQVGALTDWAAYQIYTGYFHSMAIGGYNGVRGSLWTFGRNYEGQLGLGDTDDRSSPTQVGGSDIWSVLSGGIGGNSSFAIEFSISILWSWGNNSSGQLGLGDTLDRSVPVQVGTDYNSFSGGMYQMLAITSNSALWSCGHNPYGQIGDSSTVDRSSPVQIGTFSCSKMFNSNCSNDNFYAIKSDGTLWACGDNSQEQLGDGTSNPRSNPIKIGSLTDWLSGSFGSLDNNTYAHVSSVKTDGTLWSWGNNSFGQLGLGDTTSRGSPVKVGLLTDWSSVFCGSCHTLAVKTNGTLWSWGNNDYGQLGLEDTTDRSSPVQIGALTDWVSASCGEYYSIATNNSGESFAFGSNEYGQCCLPNSANISSPVKIGSGVNWNLILAGKTFSLFNK